MMGPRPPDPDFPIVEDLGDLMYGPISYDVGAASGVSPVDTFTSMPSSLTHDSFIPGGGVTRGIGDEVACRIKKLKRGKSCRIKLKCR